MSRLQSPPLVVAGLLFAASLASNRSVLAASPVEDFFARAGAPTIYDEVPQAELQALIDRLGSADANERARAGLILRNLPGSAAAFVEQQMASGALEPAAVAEARKAIPILKARARVLAMRRQEDADVLRSALDAYDRFGLHDPQWDDGARRLITAFAKPTAVRSPLTESDAALKKLGVEIGKLGCNDPLVNYCRTRLAWHRPATDRVDAAAQYKSAVQTLGSSKYPAEWKVRSASAYSIDTTDTRETAVVRAIRFSYPEAIQQSQQMSPFGVYAFAYRAFLGSSTFPAESYFNEVYNPYAASRPADDPWPLVMKGAFHIQWGWERRDNDWGVMDADAVKEFHERQAPAREALTRAWELDHDNPAAAAEMVNLIAGDGEKEKGELDLWTRRAQAADPDDRSFYASRLVAVGPIRGGSFDAMLEFGKQCLAEGNWRGLVPFVLLDAHNRIAVSQEDTQGYLASDVVWKDVKLCYDGFLEVFPKASWHRNTYARWACRCSQWAEADRLFRQIGDNPDLDVFHSKALYDYYRRKAARLNPARPAGGLPF